MLALDWLMMFLIVGLLCLEKILSIRILQIEYLWYLDRKDLKEIHDNLNQRKEFVLLHFKIK